MCDLPRDIILCIVQKFDMDTRIKMGIIGKINIPIALKEGIARHFKMRMPIPENAYLYNACALKLPISNGGYYEMSYGGTFWLINTTERICALLYVQSPLSSTGEFPYTNGLPHDFVEMANSKGWLVPSRYAQSGAPSICAQPGSAFWIV